MSKGFVGHMRLTSDDGRFLTYCYGCCNLNIEGHSELYYYDESGEIRIAHNMLTEENTLFGEAFSMGDLQIVNASGTWQTTGDGADTIALQLLLKLYREYHENRRIPEKITWFV